MFATFFISILSKKNKKHQTTSKDHHLQQGIDVSCVKTIVFLSFNLGFAGATATQHMLVSAKTCHKDWLQRPHIFGQQQLLKLVFQN